MPACIGPDGADAAHLLNGDAPAVEIGAPAAIIRVADGRKAGGREVGFDDGPLRKAGEQSKSAAVVTWLFVKGPHGLAHARVQKDFEPGARLEDFDLRRVRRIAAHVVADSVSEG